MQHLSSEFTRCCQVALLSGPCTGSREVDDFHRWPLWSWNTGREQEQEFFLIYCGRRQNVWRSSCVCRFR